MSGEPDVLDRPFVLPPDATMVPVAELSPRVRATLGPIEGADTQVAVSRPRFRVPTRLVSPPVADLLGEFRRPSLIADAVLRYSRARELDPLQTLEDAFDALAVFINSRVLVPADSPGADALVATLAAGQEVAGYEVERLVSALEDTEVYRARTRTGEAVALKIAREDSPDAVAAALEGEARVLEHLGGRFCPGLVEVGEFRGRPFLAIQWRDGVPVTAAAQRARAGAGGRSRLGALCVEVLSAYAWLHERGVVHGDVHPGNVIVGEDGAVSILDFGRARLGAAGPDPMRAGVAHFYEPELARALLAGAVPPPPTALGEQYAVAALLYLVLTGVNYAELSAEQDVLLAQVAERPPLPFTARGAEPWPAVEAVLAVALAKDPAERFPGVGAFRDAFAAAVRAEPAPPRRLAGSDAADRLVGDWIARALDDGADGSRDLAWFALRAALARDDPDLLAAADVLAVRCDAPADWALEATRAAIHRARGDGVAQGGAARAFAAACARSDDGLDLLGGGAGALAAAAGVLEGLAGTDSGGGEAVAAWAGAALDELWGDLDAWPKLPGLAHGQAGLLYATLRACRATGTPHPAGLRERLDRLVAPRPASWCSGSAGHTLLWTLAYEELGDAAYLELAERAGRSTIDHPGTLPDLCCGTTGRAFALVRLYQATGEPSWLDAARRLARTSAVAWPDGGAADLRKGPLGTALLLVELEAPECAVLPDFGPLNVGANEHPPD